jgi:hypothetical protein
MHKAHTYLLYPHKQLPYLLDGARMLLKVGVCAVSDVEDEICVDDVVQCGLEGCDEGVGKICDESHSVDNDGLESRGELHSPHCGVQGREEHVLGLGVLVASKCAQERSFPDVGVAHESDHGNAMLYAVMSACLPAFTRQLEAFLDTDFAIEEPAPLALKLCLSTASNCVEAAPLAVEASIHALDDARAQIWEMCELDLQLGLACGRSGLEDLEDDREAVIYMHAPLLLKVLLLHGAQKEGVHKHGARFVLDISLPLVLYSLGSIQ